MITRTKNQSVYYPVIGSRADAIRGSGRIRYIRGLVVVDIISSEKERLGSQPVPCGRAL
jgi:hypothetical protein